MIANSNDWHSSDGMFTEAMWHKLGIAPTDPGEHIIGGPRQALPMMCQDIGSGMLTMFIPSALPDDVCTVGKSIWQHMQFWPSEHVQDTAAD